MTRAFELLRLVPDAPESTLLILDGARGAVDPPNRSEIFGPERFAQHGRSLGDTHRARTASRSAAFFPRLEDNIRVLRQAQRYIGAQARTGYQVSPAAEWLLDNFHLIEGQLKEIHDGLPRRYFRDLPVLVDEPLAGLPRIYGVAWAFVAHTDGAFDEDLLTHFLAAYQERRELTLGELWALPTTLRVVLVENLRRLAERLATNKAAREIANLVADRIETYSAERLDRVLTLLNRRGVGRMFLVQIAQRLQDHHATGSATYHEWLRRVMPDLAAAQIEYPAEQAADNLSVSNAIGSLRLIGNADWSELIERTSATMQLLLTSPAFEAERADTRDATLHAIELLARRCGRPETEVARQLMTLMQSLGPDAAPSHWLHGPGRPALVTALGLREHSAAWARGLRRRAALPAYLVTLAAGTIGLVWWLFGQHLTTEPLSGASPWLVGFTACLMLFPASEAVVAVINRLISESARPARLPRLALAHGIPAQHRVMVVIPALLTAPGSGAELAHRLELHYLANPERHAQFALLTDWSDSATATQADDAGLLDAAIAEIERLNARYPAPADEAPRFAVLHRARSYCATEGAWIGWERKRGKLEALIALLAQSSDEVRSDRAEGPAAAPPASPFLDLGVASRVASGVRYVVTLDGDTLLPPGRLRDLVGVAAHPHNQPEIDPVRRIVTRGYGILQPRVVTPLPKPKEATLYHWLFAGRCGIDPYSAATSEVYQDVFQQGTFTGKGLLNVRAMHAVLVRRLPEGRVLSHDLLEGAIARCAAVTDVTVIEEAPFHADVAASRVHRWTRGDWQLVPFLLAPGAYPIGAINRWKMVDNLRRSLVAPMSLALLVLTLAAGLLRPGVALGLVVAALVAGPMMGAIAGLAPSRDGIAMGHFYRGALDELRRAVAGALWLLAQLLQFALMNLDAVGRAVWRMTVSRRHLLEWTTAAAAQAAASTRLSDVLRRHRAAPLVAVALWVALLARGAPAVGVATLLCAAWAGAPLWIWWVSRPRPARRDEALPAVDRAYLENAARDTWRLFERCVGPDDNDLPPDNLQLTPHALLARRTSPTNMGLYLLASACARRFGWLGTEDLLDRLEASLATFAQLERHRGHFLNWYDTQHKVALLPRYVSTVDSGNLSGHLLAVAQACRELADDPHTLAPARRAIDASAARRAAGPGAGADVATRSDLIDLLGLSDPLAEITSRPDAFDAWLERATSELVALLPDDAAALAPTPHSNFAARAADHLATLRSTARDVRVRTAGETARTTARLQAVAEQCERLAWEPDFSFLYHRKRHLFHIGYRVAEQQLDASYYDLLASESRLTSLLAIAKGDVPAKHWSALGRPFYAVDAYAGLRSWSGSMFEYLMPTLVLDEPRGSVVSDACHAAVREQVLFARDQSVPWGISESAYAASDHTLAYQYAPQGVPRLALRRTPSDELVIAPYASALAAQIAPHLAVANFHHLDRLTPRARYGFIEALDFSPGRQDRGDGFTRVDTFMAHHQGMSIVAIANVVLDGVAQRWGMANPHIASVASLLHESAPREVSVLLEPPPRPSPDERQRRMPGMLRELVPGMGAVAPTHLLSNGRYSVALRSNGAGWSRWGGIGITRWRDDALRDQHGAFFYLRWDRQPQAVSLTQHPAPDSAAHYESTYHADRVAFDARWPEIATRTTVWVSPEDDIEFRQVELRNQGERSLDLELMSAFEITLADPRADESHPAFSNLFLRATWRPAQQALLFERKPRLATEKGQHAAHFLAEHEPAVRSLRVQTDRLGWLGRNRDPSQPLATFSSPPAGSEGEFALDTGLDPVCALSVRVALPPHGKIRLTFCTAASDHRPTLDAIIDKHRQRGPIARSSLMSATLTGIRLRELAINAEHHAAIQTLTTAVVLTLTRPRPLDGGAERNAASACDRRLLWRFGISGDRPIVLVSAGAPQGLGLLRALGQALRVWSWAGVSCDLVVINAEPSSYLMALQRDLAALREQFAAQTSGGGSTSFRVLRADELSPEELATLRVLARLHFNADGRPLTHHMQDWADQHEQAMQERQAGSTSALRLAASAGAVPRTTSGEFMPAGGEFRFDVSIFQRPARPWINVLANPMFGTQVSEAGGGYTWALNSRLNQLTPWSNDPLADPPGEWFLLQDLRTREIWSVTPTAWGDPAASYRVAHGQGYSAIGHRRGDLEVSATWCVDPQSPVKQLRLRLVNRGNRNQRLRAVGLVEWIMGAGRADRGSTETAALTQRIQAGDAGRRVTILSCTQRDRAAGFGDGTAFLAVATDASEALDWTCDRREFFDARGRPVLPDNFAQHQGAGLDPCAALALRLQVPAGQTAECVFLLGYGATAAEARQLAATAAAMPASERFDASRKAWEELLQASTVKTPDPLFDALVNHWLLYQTVSCRLWAKAGFYQAGGAFGFRDQLQDAMALAWSAPEMLRRQILLNASRQFPEGDVQHWWHAPTGAGVRTHFSDDLLWLPHAIAAYVRTTGDAGVLDAEAGFVEGGPIPEGAEDAYYAPTLSATTATVYEHGARAIDRSLRSGPHGLPLMGTGDWNDGMNRVGAEGRGESVWLAWFLCQLVEDFTPIARQRGDDARATRWEEAAKTWREALKGDAWDGQWYRRAFFDDGTPLGSSANRECRIDLIAQAWSVISNAAPAAFQRMAMCALDRELVDPEAGLIKLLSPALQFQTPSAGYIQAYPPGVRENGGQYSHAGVWALIAQAMGGDGDAAYRYFTYLSPAHRAAHPARRDAYAIEPYVMAGDVYTETPFVGRGGWSWYTGSAAWMHRAAIEHMFGMRQRGDDLSFRPCLPSHWNQAELTLRRGDRRLRVVMVRAGVAAPALSAALEWRPGEVVAWSLLGRETTALLRLPAGPGDKAGGDAQAPEVRPAAS